MEVQRILVYAQAVPKHFPSGARKFSDLSRSEFVINHSSKSALAQARRFFAAGELVVAGYHRILAEGLALGADRALSLPLCDNPLDQAKSFPTSEQFFCIVIGENPEGSFSGASLSGALVSLRKTDLVFADKLSEIAVVRGIVLLRDDLESPHNIDIRRINFAQQNFPKSEVDGSSSIENSKPAVTNEYLHSSSSKEISELLSRRLNRLAGWLH